MLPAGNRREWRAGSRSRIPCGRPADRGVQRDAAHPSAGTRPRRHRSRATGWHSMPCPAVSRAGCPCRRDAPQMPAVDIALVGRVDDHRAAVGASATSSTSKSPGVSSVGFAACRGHRIEVRPAVAFPREDDAPAGRPEQLVCRRPLRGTRCPVPRARARSRGPRRSPASATRIDHGSPARCGFAHRAHAGAKECAERDARGRRATTPGRGRNRCWGRDSAARRQPTS